MGINFFEIFDHFLTVVDQRGIPVDISVVFGFLSIRIDFHAAVLAGIVQHFLAFFIGRIKAIKVINLIVILKGSAFQGVEIGVFDRRYLIEGVVVGLEIVQEILHAGNGFRCFRRHH